MGNAFCSKCGASLAPGVAFCSSCGERTAAQTQLQPAYNTAPAQPQYVPQPQYGYQQPAFPARRSNTGKIIAIIAAAAVVIAGVILLIVLLGGGGAGIKPGDINGTWSGTAKITQIGPTAADYGISSNVGDEDDVSMKISLGEDGTGTIDFQGVGTLEATLRGGQLSANITNEYSDLVFTIEGSVSKTNNSYTFNGTIKFITSDNTMLIVGSMQASMES